MGPEKIFENKIKKYLKSQGAWFIKYWSGGSAIGKKFTKDGIPDLLCCVNGRFIALEVKAENGNPSPLQLDTIEELREAGAIALVVYPSAWPELKSILDQPWKEYKDLPVILKYF